MHVVGTLKESADKLNNTHPMLMNPLIEKADEDGSEAVLFLSDWHFGIEADNIWNTYNISVLKQRVSKLVSRTVKYMRRHRTSVLHVAILGDMIAGAIHGSSRVQSEELTSDQLMHVCEMLAEVVHQLSNYVQKVVVYSTYGNHARTVQNFKDSVHSDNMERLIPWWLEQRLQNNKRVVIDKSAMYEFLLINLCGQTIIASHGDLDSKDGAGVDIVQLFSRKYGITANYFVKGHNHNRKLSEDLDIECLTIGAMCGTEEFANGKRLFTVPSQSLVMFTKLEGKECQYDIRFND